MRRIGDWIFEHEPAVWRGFACAAVIYAFWAGVTARQEWIDGHVFGACLCGAVCALSIYWVLSAMTDYHEAIEFRRQFPAPYQKAP